MEPSEKTQLLLNTIDELTLIKKNIKRAIDICTFEKLESTTSLKAGMYQIRLILEQALIGEGE